MQDDWACFSKIDVITVRSYKSTMKDYDYHFAAECKSQQAVEKFFGDAPDIPPRLKSVLDSWSSLPPHVQETISLLAELKSQQLNDKSGSDFESKQHQNCQQQMENGRRVMLRALRHVPEQYDLRMDVEGWVSVEGIMNLAGRHIPNVNDLGISALIKPLGDRVELKDDRIRATYGHSSKAYCPAVPSIPDVPLYHGTVCQNWPMIELFGLRSMNRRFVQLTCEYEYAREIAFSSGQEPLVLQVKTAAAREGGVQFFATGTHVWLAEYVPADYLQVWGDSSTADVLGVFDRNYNHE